MHVSECSLTRVWVHVCHCTPMTVKEQPWVSVLTLYLYKVGTMFAAAHTRLPDPQIPPLLFLTLLMHAEITYGCCCILLSMSSGDPDSGVHTYMAHTSAIEPFAQLCLPVPN